MSIDTPLTYLIIILMKVEILLCIVTDHLFSVRERMKLNQAQKRARNPTDPQLQNGTRIFRRVPQCNGLLRVQQKVSLLLTPAFNIFAVNEGLAIIRLKNGGTTTKLSCLRHTVLHKSQTRLTRIFQHAHAEESCHTVSSS